MSQLFLKNILNLAKTTKYSTALQAAKIARMLVLKNLCSDIIQIVTVIKKTFIKEAVKIFKSVILSEDLKSFSI